MKPTGNLVADTICRTAGISLTITGAADADTITTIDAVPVAVSDTCLECGHSGKLRDRTLRQLVDLPAVDLPSHLDVRIPRFLCTATPCPRKIFQTSLTCTDDGFKLTHRTTRWIPQRLTVDRMSVSATTKVLDVGWDLVN